MKQISRPRFFEIDALRAIGILGVMAIHILSFNLSNSITTFFWNYLQFVVVIFIFCSGFVLSTRNINSFGELLAWYKKRVLRILLPFYVYFAIHYLLFLAFPQYFTNYGMQRSPEFVIKSLILAGGLSANWIPLLFLQLSLVFPLVNSSNKRLQKTLIALTLLVSLLFSFYTFPYSHYRAAMWLPWTFILFVAIGSKAKNIINMRTKNIWLFGLLSLGVYVLLFVAYMYLGKSQSQSNFINNKYPPNLYYFSYSLAISAVVFIGIRAVKWGNSMKNTIEFLSKNSYSLFFVHFLFLDALISWRKMTQMQIPVIAQLVGIIGISVGVVYGYNFIKQRIG